MNVAGNWRGKKVSPAVRFASKLLPQADGCIHFDASHDKDGYPKFSVGGKVLRAARFIFPLATGEDLTADDCVCHTCDNPRCVNAEHMWKGVVAENNADRSRKGRDARHSKGGRFGSPRDENGRFLPACL